MHVICLKYAAGAIRSLVTFASPSSKKYDANRFSVRPEKNPYTVVRKLRKTISVRNRLEHIYIYTFALRVNVSFVQCSSALDSVSPIWGGEGDGDAVSFTEMLGQIISLV